MIDFDVGESHCAILAMLRPNGTLTVPWKRRARATDGYGEEIKTLIYDFNNEAINTVEIRVISEWNDLLLEPLVFKVSVVDGQPFATRSK